LFEIVHVEVVVHPLVHDHAGIVVVSYTLSLLSAEYQQSVGMSTKNVFDSQVIFEPSIG
jgi:hypothetical protein